jgi:phosphohistidine phosphatase
MKTVLLLRHAKSSWDDPSLPDFHRPLAPRGRRAAPLVADYLTDHGLIPDRVLCSSAHRARETWEIVSEGLEQDTDLVAHLGAGPPPVVELREDIYHASSSSLLEMVQSLDDAEESVLLVGHNPTFETLADVLAGTGDRDGMTRMRRKYPTAALAVIDFPVSHWSEVGPGKGYLRAFVRPKDLG